MLIQQRQGIGGDGAIRAFFGDDRPESRRPGPDGQRGHGWDGRRAVLASVGEPLNPAAVVWSQEALGVEIPEADYPTLVTLNSTAAYLLAELQR